jgi:alkanesulfonate monooxygenase SsuD/methylene tetrahydromethanopterin reductase-like flavin-dependent oxidoreductase (luciferase family)
MAHSDRPLGVTVMPIENRLDILQYVAVRADALGYEGFGLPETWSYDTAVLLSAIAQQTQNIKLTSGIWGVWGRSAATIAMAAATLNMVSHGRFQLGLGASTPQLTEGWHDRPFDKPYTQLRQTVLQVAWAESSNATQRGTASWCRCSGARRRSWTKRSAPASTRSGC